MYKNRSQVRDEKLRIYLNPSEKDEIQAAADDAGYERATFIREASLAAARFDWFQSIKNFIESLGFEQVLKAAEITISARSMIFAKDTRRFKYFCGICWNLIRG